MGSFSIWHWLVVLAIVVIIFGTKKLRNIGSDLGGAIKNFKDSMQSGDEEQDKAAKPAAPKKLESRVVEGEVTARKTTRKTAKKKA